MSVSEGDATQAPSNAGAEAGSERGVPSAVNLQKMKIADLHQLCRDRGIRRFAKLNKVDLVDYIRQRWNSP